MFKQLLIFLCLLLGAQSSLEITNTQFTKGDVYNITWNYTGPVGLFVETHLNNSWIVTENQGCKYLSIVLDNGQQFFLWTIPESFYKYWNYGNRVNVINLSNNVVLKNTTFSIKNQGIMDPVITTYRGSITTQTSMENTFTTEPLTNPTEPSNNNNESGKVCLVDTCLTIYSIVIMSIISLIILCLCCKCLC